MRFSFKNIARKSLSGSWFVLAAIVCLVSPMVQAQFEVKHSFRPPLLPNGNAVYSRLVEDEEGSLYFATSIGGEFRSVPTISRLTKDRSFFAGIYQFPEGSGQPMLASDGMLYVVTTHDQRIFRITRFGRDYQVLHRFNGTATNGFNPTVPLTEGSDGMLYGTTESGGANAAGTIFRINKNGSGFQVIKHLQTATGKTPRGVLLEGSNGLLYGTTWEGGTTGKGVLFRLAKNGTGYTVIHEFGGSGDGSNPIGTMVEVSGQGLFGVTDNSVYQINLDGSGYQRLSVTNSSYRFSGGLVAANDGKIYGEITGVDASFAGGLFRVEPSNGLFESIHLFTDFGEGHNPIGLVASSDGFLYGGLRNSDEWFGWLNGLIYQFDPTNKVYGHIISMANTKGQAEGRPEAGVTVDINGDFVGILNDVTNDVRIVFSISKVNYSYAQGVGGTMFLPKDTLTLDSDGSLYGAGLPTYEAPQGFPGGHTNGGVFCFDARGRYKQLYIFPSVFTPNPEDSAPNGRDIQTGVIVGQDGYLYGTTAAGGGSYVAGVLYKIAKSGTNYIKLHDFGTQTLGGNVGGMTPMSKPYQAADGWLYGSTQHGGTHFQAGITNGSNPMCGVLYRLRPDGTSKQLLHDFAGSPTDGAFVCAELIQGSNGRLYGVAKGGGQYTNGVIFSLNVDGSDYQVLHHFNDALEEGKHPTAAMVWVEGYGLYGITSEGGLAGVGGGTIFEIQPDGSGFTVLHKFATVAGNGAKPLHKLVVGHDKLLYGTTQAGGDWNYGTFFRFDPGFLRVSQVTQAGQQLTLHLKGKPNESYHLERSPSLGAGADWQDAGTSGQLSAAGEAQVNTTISSEAGFYRIVRE